jgi:N-acetylmuramoyl-L-alanine amidase
VAKLICDEICKACGFKNRGVKRGDMLFVVKHTLAPAVLVEVCFCDSELDMRLYNADKAADAIVSGISEFAKTRKTNLPQ